MRTVMIALVGAAMLAAMPAPAQSSVDAEIAALTLRGHRASGDDVSAASAELVNSADGQPRI